MTLATQIVWDASQNTLLATIASETAGGATRLVDVVAAARRDMNQARQIHEF